MRKEQQESREAIQIIKQENEKYMKKYRRGMWILRKK